MNPAREPHTERHNALRQSLDSWWLDVKLGGRMLIKYPGLAVVGGVGIAVAVAIAVGGFSLIYGTFLVPSVPLEEGDRIVAIEIWDSAAGEPELRSLYDFQAWRSELNSVREIGAFRMLTPTLIAPGVPPESVRVASITASAFRVARVRPLMGRYLEDEDESEGARSVVVIGETFWRNRFEGDPAILGRTIQLGATPHSVIGVMPKDFAFPVNDYLWVPLRNGVAPSEPRTGPHLSVFGRLAPGATLEGAQAELTAIGQRKARAFPKTYAQLQPLVMPYTRSAEDTTGIFAMQVVFVALLVLVCLNVAILVYTRTAMRQAEIGLRTALGASRGRIVAQLFVEAFVLSLVAALAGIALAALGIRQVAGAMVPLAAELPFWMSFGLIPGAVLYALALSVLAAAIVGILPALQATRGLKGGFRVAGASGIQLGKTWTTLIIAQVGFAVALLPPAASSAWEETQNGFAGVGFAAEEFLSAALGMDSISTTPEFTRRFAARQSELMRRLEAEPRVSNVTFAMTNPGSEPEARIEAEDNAYVHAVRLNRVDIDFFRVFEVPLLVGRGLEQIDLPAENSLEGRTVVVSQSLAQRIFGGNALGRRIRYVEREPGPWHEIVGIVSDFPTGASQGMRDPNRARVYHAVAVGQVNPAAIAIRMREGAPATFTQPLRELALAVDPDLHLRNIRGLDETLRSEQWISRLQAAVIVGVTVSVLLLSSAGIFSLMSFTVSQRRKEIGIRIALGAEPRRIVTNIFSRALLQLAAGAAAGAALGFWLEKASGGVIMRGNLAVALPGVVLVVMAVGFLAALGPARRSLRIQPTEALKEE
jgi:putative ABC transport system permease protein